jgi:PAS domain S-box-containing protein
MTSLDILIADDHAMFRRSLRALIESQPEWRVCAEAADGKEAVEKAIAFKPQVILMDVSMPEMNGLEATRIIRKKAPECQTLVVSQNDPQLMKKAAQQAGAIGFIHKATLSQDLIRVIRDLVRDDDGGGPDGANNMHSASARRSGETAGNESAPESAERTSADLERKLRLDAEMLASIVTSSDDAIISKNLDGIIKTWNKGAERIFGYTAEEAVGNPITMIIPRDRWDEEITILARLRRGERIDHFETIRQRKDGTLLNLSVTISPLRDATGHVIGASKVARDITQQKRAEEVLRESEERLRALVKASSYAIYRVTPDWKQIRQLHGQTPADDDCIATEEWLNTRVHPDDRAMVQSAIDDSTRTKSVFEREYRVIQPDGSIGWSLARAVPVLNAKSEVIEWFGGVSDVTASRRAQENYRKLAETLDAEVRLRTKELEARNADVLRQADQLRDLSQRLLQLQDEERRHIARELHDSAGQTLTVLGMALVKLANLGSGMSPETARQLAEAESLVQQLHREIRTTSYLLHPPLLDENGLNSALNWYSEGLTERSGLDIQLNVPADFGRMPRELELAVFRMVQECLTNIHRHSGASCARIRIVRDDNNICIEVEDNGKGMSPDRLVEVQTGGGVGIRGIRERVRRFGGKVTIQSDASGTKIAVNIPIPEPLEHEIDLKPLKAAV